MIYNLLLTWVNLQTFDTCIGRVRHNSSLRSGITSHIHQSQLKQEAHMPYQSPEFQRLYTYFLLKGLIFALGKELTSCSRSTWKQQTKRWSISCTLFFLRSKITYMYNRNWPQNTFLNITLNKSLHPWVVFFVWVCEIALTLVWSNIWSLLWFPPISQLKVGESITPLS